MTGSKRYLYKKERNGLLKAPKMAGKDNWDISYNGKKFLECKENIHYFLNNYMPLAL